MKVIHEMKQRGYRNDSLWENPYYRGKVCTVHTAESLNQTTEATGYPEHDENYLQECLDNLQEKGVYL